MAERRLTMVRHSLSEIRPDLPPALWRLSSDGVTRARSFAMRLDPGTATCVFTSSEPKAAETAHLLGGIWKVPVEEVAGLHEHERHEARILSRAQFEERIREMFARPSELVFGAESADDARRRFTATVMHLIRRTVGDLVIVSHGTVMALFVGAETGIEPFPFWKRQEMPFAVTLALPDLILEGTTFLNDE